MRYHSCDHSRWDGSSTSHSLCCQSVVLPDSSTNVCEVCINSSRPSLPLSSGHCVFPFMTQGADMFHTYLRNCCLHQLPSLVSIKTATSVGCSNFLNSYSPFSQFSACCRKIEPRFNESQAKEESDIQGAYLSPTYSLIPPSSTPQQNRDAITGLRCQTNRTLRFYVLDAALNWPLAVGLGASSNRSAFQSQETSSQSAGSVDGSFAAIVNLKEEIHYVLHRSPAATLTESLGKTKTLFHFRLSLKINDSFVEHTLAQSPIKALSQTRYKFLSFFYYIGFRLVAFSCYFLAANVYI